MTAQATETLRYNNEEYEMANEPLNAYLAKLPVKPDLRWHNTACWRGYYGTWEIKDNKLYLIDLMAYTEGYRKVGMDFIFPNQTEVFAEWYSGEIRLPHGEMLKYYHAGYASVYEKDLFLVIENGVLKSNYTIHNLDRFGNKVNANIPMPPKRKSLWKRIFG